MIAEDTVKSKRCGMDKLCIFCKSIVNFPENHTVLPLTFSLFSSKV